VKQLKDSGTTAVDIREMLQFADAPVSRSGLIYEPQFVVVPQSA
jgi:hypothetical protein